VTPLAIVTCGPSHAPIDAMRRITNASTGEIGAILSSALLSAGFEVVCFRGSGSTAPPPAGAATIAFDTNSDLLDGLKKIAGRPRAVFHAAALCDFEPAEVSPGKIPTSCGEILLRLRPAAKVLPLLRPLFPDAFLVGWKYEVEGSRENALAKGLSQIAACQTSACAVNGPAIGSGFELVSPDGGSTPFPDKTALAAALAAAARREGLPADFRA